jgi:hypothetical protein
MGLGSKTRPSWLPLAVAWALGVHHTALGVAVADLLPEDVPGADDAHDFLVVLYGTEKSHDAFRLAQSTWLKGFPSILVSEVDDASIPTVGIGGQKSHPGKRWGGSDNDGANKPPEMILYANRTRAGTFKWLWRGDADTGFKMPALTRYLSSLDSTKPLILGKCQSEMKCLWEDKADVDCTPCCRSANETCVSPYPPDPPQSIAEWAKTGNRHGRWSTWQPPSWPYGAKCGHCGTPRRAVCTAHCLCTPRARLTAGFTATMARVYCAPARLSVHGSRLQD